jgi:hypothetical protein
MYSVLKKMTFLGLCASLLLACGGNESNQENTQKDTTKVEKTETESQETKKEEPKVEVSEADIKAFLNSKEGTYGWNPTTGDLGLDFFKDGRLVVQGPGGESELWEGKWSLAGDQLTMECTNCGKMPAKQTVQVKIDGENLVLGDKTYTRYAPK